MRTSQILICTKIILLIAIFLTVFTHSPTYAENKDTHARTPEEILAEFDGLPSDDAAIELFINASEWDADHQDVKESSHAAIIELGGDILPPILDEFLSSRDVRRRHTLDLIVRAIGYPANRHLLKYLSDENWVTRRHAGYLIGDSCYAESQEDKSLLGPFQEDAQARSALVSALESETEYKVTRQLILSLGKLRDPKLIPTIAGYLDHEEEYVRLNVAIGIGHIPHVDSFDVINRCYDDEMGSVRQAAILSASSVHMGQALFDKFIQNLRNGNNDSQTKCCQLNTLTRYLVNISEDETNLTKKHRKDAYAAAISIISNRKHRSVWLTRGYAIELIEHTKQQQAIKFLDTWKRYEKHPFVQSKIQNALDG